jgi:hypothetical protein
MRFRTLRQSLFISLMSFGILFSHYAYFPGLVVNDSSDQFHQAQTFQFSDWHPPIMAVIWSLTNRILPGPEGFFLLQIVLYWGGFLLIGLRIIGQSEADVISRYRLVLLCLLPFSPFLINICGTIWKDVLVFGCFITALGLIFSRSKESRIWSWRSAIILGLLVTGSLARHNSIAGAVPLLVLYLWPESPVRNLFWAVFGRVVVATVVTVTTVFVVGKSLDIFVTHSTKTHIGNSILLFDMVGISERIDRNLVPGIWSHDETRQILDDCYTPAAWNSLSPSGHCHFVSDRLMESGEWQKGLLTPWTRALGKYPREYLEHRVDYMHTLLWPQTTFVLEPNKESFEFGFGENMVFKGIRYVMVSIRYQFPLYLMLTDGFWLALSVVTAGVTYIRYRAYPKAYYRSLLVAVSAVFYATPLAVVGLAGDFRYVYWTAGAVCIAGLLAPWTRAGAEGRT